MWVGCASNQPTFLESRRSYFTSSKNRHLPKTKSDSSLHIKDYHYDSTLFPDKKYADITESKRPADEYKKIIL